MPSHPGRKSGITEAEVVYVSDIAPVIKRWINRWNAERPANTQYSFGSNRNGKTEFVSAYQWLAQETERLGLGTGIGISSLVKIASNNQKTISLRQADLILTAIREFDLLGREIRVYPNPDWSNERWREYMAERGCV
jgi:hypothetical protein